MDNFAVSDISHAKDEIAAHLSLLPMGESLLSPARKERIIANCVRPVCLLGEATSIVGAAGTEEQAVFVFIVRSWTSHIDSEVRRRGFEKLLHKLAACQHGAP